ncbi:hypothetical protein BGZ83_003309 [Gryganskiella cystojenkinii]|nr:hypothetical protein BGZ83_003309 [Gryganskiella cystojenkinii]
MLLSNCFSFLSYFMFILTDLRLFQCLSFKGRPRMLPGKSASWLPIFKWFLEGVGHDGLNKMLDGFDDRSAFALCTFALSEGPGTEPILFEGRNDGSIVAARGPTHFGWDPVFLPDGYDTTYAEMDKETKNIISHRSRALAKLRAYLEKDTN